MTVLPWLCRHCHYEIEADDVWLELTHGYCICVRCANATLQTEKHLARRLREDVARSANTNEVPN